MINKLIFILIGLSIYSCHITSSIELSNPHAIPFTLTDHNNILIKAVINSKDTVGSIGRQKMSVLGGDLLKHFNIIIDRKNGFIYIKPNQLMDTPFK